MRESTVEQWTCDELAKHGVRNIKLRTKGWPDRAFFANGLTCFVEFKRPGEKVSDPHQMVKIAELKGLNFSVFEQNEKSETFVKKVLQVLGFNAIF